MSKFQIVLLVVFGVFILVAVAVFALYRGGSATLATVTIWGDISANDFNTLLADSIFSGDRSLSVKYEERSQAGLERDFTEALAQGNGPDLVIISQDQFYKNKNKFLPIPYQSISQKDFSDTFVQAGEVFFTTEGIYALPIIIDPLVLYYNRDLLSNAGISKPVMFWDEIYNQTFNLSKRDAAGNLTQSALAMGESRNIKNFKDILSLLMLQAGTPITGFLGDNLRSFIANNFDLSTLPADSALDFYTQFSNPTKTYYSWNRILPEAQTRFASGDLAYYIGFAHEVSQIRSKSPTLNFAVAPIPQSRVSGTTITFAKVKGVAISRGAKNTEAAFNVLYKLISVDSATKLSQILGLPPARRDLLALPPSDAIFPVFYNGAIQSRVWVDPDSNATREIFANMIDDVTSGRARTTETVNRASRELDNLIN